VINHPETDFNPLWMPDSKTLIFFSNRTGSVSVWALLVNNGKAEGEAKLIKNFSRLSPKTITPDGDLYMTFHEGGFDVYKLSVDAQLGKIIDKPKRYIETNVGWNGAASYSSDGKHMVYVSQRGVLNTAVSWGQQSLVIRDLISGTERELIPKLRLIQAGWTNMPRWSPDNTEILVRGRNAMGHNGVFIVNVQDTSVIPLTKEREFLARDIIWSKSKNLLYYYVTGDTNTGGIYSFERNSELTKQLLKNNNIKNIELHPDGRSLLVEVDKKVVRLDLTNNKIEELLKS